MEITSIILCQHDAKESLSGEKNTLTLTTESVGVFSNIFKLVVI